MSTTEVAARLVAYIRKGQIDEAQEELYADNIVCVEPPETITQQLTKGKRDVIEKRKQFAAMIKESHYSDCSDPVVADRHFTLNIILDITLKGLGRQRFDEIGVYEVKNGKIVHEQFFYTQPALAI